MSIYDALQSTFASIKIDIRLVDDGVTVIDIDHERGHTQLDGTYMYFDRFEQDVVNGSPVTFSSYTATPAEIYEMDGPLTFKAGSYSTGLVLDKFNYLSGGVATTLAKEFTNDNADRDINLRYVRIREVS